MKVIVQQIVGAEPPADPLYRADCGALTAYGNTRAEALANLDSLACSIRKIFFQETDMTPYPDNCFDAFRTFSDYVLKRGTATLQDAALAGWNIQGFVQKLTIGSTLPIPTFGMPAKEDGCPCTVEDLACYFDSCCAATGTPVVGFDWRAVLDILVPVLLEWLRKK